MNSGDERRRSRADSTSVPDAQEGASNHRGGREWQRRPDTHSSTAARAPSRQALAMAVGFLTAFTPVLAVAQEQPPHTQPSTGANTPPAIPDGARPAMTPSQPGAPHLDAPVSEATVQEAQLHFEKGLALLEEEAWSPALSEFLLSRKLYPTRVATNNAGIALQKLQRYDEALDMFEAFLRDFTVSAEERADAQRKIAELRMLVGTIDLVGAAPAATIVIGGQDRGQYPPVKPLRVAAGTHVVRVFKEGYEPFERRVDVAGGQTVNLKVKLERLTRSGRLRVVESSGKAVNVVVDNAVVGPAPWSGTLSVGDHVVMLRGEGKLGSPPTTAVVKPQEQALLTLVAEELDATLHVEPSPPGASVWIDSVNVGNGVWIGRLKQGTHQVEARADGFLVRSRPVTLNKGKREKIRLTLERDEDATMWRKPPKVTLDATTSFLFVPTLGGDLASGCNEKCRSAPGLGGAAMVHGTYEFGSGLGIGAELGALVAVQSMTDRTAGIVPVGASLPSEGTTNESLRLGAFFVGATIGYHINGRFPSTLRLGAGVLVAEVRDERAGNFALRRAEGRFDAGSAVDFPRGVYAFFDPEARFGFRVAEHVELSGGLKLLMLLTTGAPRWDERQELLADVDGIANYPPESVMGDVVFMLAPSVNMRYEF